MKKVTLTRYHLAAFLVACLALAGLVWTRPKPASADGDKVYDLDSLEGRFVSAGRGNDISSVHNAAGGNVGPAIDFDSATVVVFDGKGKVCGESLGFYALGTAGAIPGANSGPSTFHGTNTIDPTTGRITIDTCSDPGPFCVTPAPNCTGTASPDITAANDTFAVNNHKTRSGYIQGYDGKQFVTVERVNNSFSSGFLNVARTWEKGQKKED